VNQLVCAQLGMQASCPLNAPLPREDPLLAGRVRVDGLGWHFGIFGGVMVTPWPWLRIGLGAHSNGLSVDVPITVNVRVPPKALDFIQQSLPGVVPSAIQAEGKTEVGLPVILTAGVAVTPLDELELGLEFHFLGTQVSTYSYTAITRTTSALVDDVNSVKGKHNKYVFALRGAYRLMQDLTAGLRIEYGSNTRAEEFTSPTSLDTYKTSIQVGLAWEVDDWVEILVEYGHFFLANRRIRVSRFGPKAAPVTDAEKSFDLPSPTGLYKLQGQRGGLGARFRF
jgi:hypothetical protein